MNEAEERSQLEGLVKMCKALADERAIATTADMLKLAEEVGRDAIRRNSQLFENAAHEAMLERRALDAVAAEVLRKGLRAAGRRGTA